jgi:hypothetical protein
MGRIFGFLSVVIVMGVGMYIYSRQATSSSAAAGANNPQAAINITGVKSDLTSIAQAERRYFATEGKYASFDELVSANYISVARQRPPYSYEVQTSSSGFHVVATRSGANIGGTPAQLSVDENMSFRARSRTSRANETHLATWSVSSMAILSPTTAAIHVPVTCSSHSSDAS